MRSPGLHGDDTGSYINKAHWFFSACRRHAVAYKLYAKDLTQCSHQLFHDVAAVCEGMPVYHHAHSFLHGLWNAKELVLKLDRPTYLWKMPPPDDIARQLLIYGDRVWKEAYKALVGDFTSGQIGNIGDFLLYAP